MNWKRIPKSIWNWKRPIISLGVVYVLLSLLVVSCADRLMFFPPRPSYDEKIQGFTKIPAEKTSHVSAIHLKAKPNAPTIIYSHGNAEDIGQSLDLFTALNERGFGVIAYEYPGYGICPGKPTEGSTYQAIQAAWDYAISSGIPASSIVIVGRSIGTGPSVWLASHTKPAGLVLISPLKSAYHVAFNRVIFPFNPFPTYKRIKDINTPLLVIHSERDEVIPFSHGQEIYQTSPATNKFFVPIKNTGHNDMFYRASDQILNSVEEFIKQLPKS